MATVILGSMVATLVVLVAVTAVQGDLNVGQNDLDHKRAYAAAQAGLADYSFHLNNDTNYWAKCTSVPSPNAVNQQGVDDEAPPGPRRPRRALRDRADPGDRAGPPAARPTPPASMIEQTGSSIGTFRIRSTGLRRQGEAADRRDLQAGELPRLRLLHAARDLRPGHLRRRRRRSPAPTSSARKTIEQGRLNAPIPNSGGDYCDVILFVERRDDRRPPPHQRRAHDLRRAELRPHGRRRDRGLARRRGAGSPAAAAATPPTSSAPS